MDRPVVEDPRRPATLRAAPLQVGALLAERLFRTQTVVLTSATLALGGSFEPLARQWALPRPGTDVPGPEPGQLRVGQPGAGESAPAGPEPSGAAETDAGQATAAGAAAAGPGTDNPGEPPAEPSAHGLAWSGLDVGSPFDHPHRGILYVAKHLPPPAAMGSRRPT